MDISQFNTYTVPAGGVTARCYVLRPEEEAAVLDFMVENLPSCYIRPTVLAEKVADTGMTAGELLANKLPDPGNVMSGDFGEIATLFFLNSESPDTLRLVRKWRHKQDRLKAAPHSDVVLIHRADKNQPTVNDYIICAESKQKSTKGKFAPIEKAVAGIKTDQTGRLGRCLAWLREKAIDDGRMKDKAFLERFTDALSMTYSKHYKAVAIVDRQFLDQELTRQPLAISDGSFEIVVLAVSDLKTIYETVFARAIQEVAI